MCSRRRPASICESSTSSGTRAVRRIPGRARRRWPTVPRERIWNRSVRPRARCSGTSGTWPAVSSSRAGPTAICASATRISLPIHRGPFAASSRWSACSMLTSPSPTPARRARHRITAWRATRIGSATAPRNRRLVSTLTSPLLLRYGYPLRPAVNRSPADETIFDRAPAGEGTASRLARRVRRHLRWGRTEGFSRLVEEDELNPVTRARVAAAKWEWRRSHPRPAGLATPVYLVGLQRSGTNMLARCLDIAPEFEVHNENDKAVFDHFLLRDDEVVRRVVMTSRHQYVLFKPLCDSHRVDHLLDALDTPSPGRAIWAYRDVDGRVRSAVSKFGRNNLLTLRDIAAGKGAAMWQAQRLSKATLDEIGSYDYMTMTPETAAALFWWIRNGLYFETGLDRRDDVLLASYQDMLATPVPAMQAICQFLGLAYRPTLIEHISPRGPGSPRQLDIDLRVRALCDHLQDRLDEALRAQRDGAAA